MLKLRILPICILREATFSMCAMFLKDSKYIIYNVICAFFIFITAEKRFAENDKGDLTIVKLYVNAKYRNQLFDRHS